MEEIEIYSRFSEIYSPSAISEYEENSEREKRNDKYRSENPKSSFVERYDAGRTC